MRKKLPRYGRTHLAVLKSPQLSSGARIIYPYLDAFGTWSSKESSWSFLYSEIEPCLHMSLQGIMAWLSDLVAHNHIKDAYCVEIEDGRDHVIRYNFPGDIQKDVRKKVA